MTRYPLRPLTDLAGSNHALGQALHVSGATLKVLAVCELTPDQADKFACRLGVHPGAVWETWFDDALTVNDDIFVNRGGGWRHAWLYDHKEAV